MFSPNVAVALLAGTLALHTYAIRRVDLQTDHSNEISNTEFDKSGPQGLGGAALVSDELSEQGIDFNALQAARVEEFVQEMEILSAIENQAAFEKTYNIKTINYMETAFDNSRNLRSVKNPNSGRYKDLGWWPLLWTAGYGLTHEQKYLEEVEQLLSIAPGRWGNFCGQGSRCGKMHAYVKISLRELALVITRITDRMSNRSWLRLDWAVRRYDITASIPADAEEADRQEPSLEGCSGRSKSQFDLDANVAGGFIELRFADSTKFGTVHKLARAFMVDIFEKNVSNERELDTDGYEFQFNKVFMKEIQELQQFLPEEQYQQLLGSELSRIMQKARANGSGSISWVGPCFPLHSAARDWICWALILQ
ncbi:MAG: hypothetical protein M1821_009468 [Bathelium mastoideum]|nr:MAG: hypothetical protein M1821_009468 [Bathelium mastoideum]